MCYFINMFPFIWKSNTPTTWMISHLFWVQLLGRVYQNEHIYVYCCITTSVFIHFYPFFYTRWDMLGYIWYNFLVDFVSPRSSSVQVQCYAAGILGLGVALAILNAFVGSSQLEMSRFLFLFYSLDEPKATEHCKCYQKLIGYGSTA